MKQRSSGDVRIFPEYFSSAAMSSYMETQETFSYLFEDKAKYNVIMNAMSEMLYRDLHRPGGKK